MGKHKPTYSDQADNGDYVVVINASDVALTGKKSTNKLYRWHTGWMGGLKTLTARQMFERDTTRIISLAVKGMLPPNRLRDRRLKRLRVFVADEHTHLRQLEESQQFAPEYIQVNAPVSVTPRLRADTGALVKDARSVLTAEQLAELEKQFVPLAHDEEFAAKYSQYRSSKTEKAQLLQDITDARILARVQELEEAESSGNQPEMK